MQLANSTMCKQNLHEINKSLMMYRLEYDGWLPVDTAPDEEFEAKETVSSQPAPVSDVWFLKLYYGQYLSDLRALVCRADPYGFRMMQALNGVNGAELADYPSYGMSRFIMEHRGGVLARVDRFQIRADSTILVADLGPDQASGGAAGSGLAGGPLRSESLLAWDDGFQPDDGASWSEPWVTARHGEGINILTVAGGVRSARTIEVIREGLIRSSLEGELGMCTLCLNEEEHYSFARDQLYWWVGPVR